MPTPEQTPEIDLLTEIADSLQKDGEAVSWEDLRWTLVNGRKDPAVVIQRRGRDRRVLATISKQGKYARMYASWQPVIDAWKAERANTGKRVDHDELPKGELPGE